MSEHSSALGAWIDARTTSGPDSFRFITTWGLSGFVLGPHIGDLPTVLLPYQEVHCENPFPLPGSRFLNGGSHRWHPFITSAVAIM